MDGDAAGHDSAEGLAVFVLEFRTGEWGQFGLGEEGFAVGADLGYGVVVGQGYVDCGFLDGYAGGGCSAYGGTSFFRDFCAEAEFSCDGRSGGIGYVVGPEGAAFGGVFIAEPGDFFAFDDSTFAGGSGGIAEGREAQAGVVLFVARVAVGILDGGVFEEAGVGDVEMFAVW